MLQIYLINKRKAHALFLSPKWVVRFPWNSSLLADGKTYKTFFLHKCN